MTPFEQVLARLDQARQDDEQIAGDERDDQRIARAAEKVAHADSRQRRNQSRQHPQCEHEQLKKGHKAGDKTFKVHIDGYNLLPS
jgi:hypothetical protein